MIIEDDKAYLPRDLRQYLKDLGLPFSRTTLWRLEKTGVLEPRIKDSWRLYTGKEIKEIARKVKEHKSV